ncbi:carboxyvinyl-carboxyphosphonate phosphorylmutase [Allostella sp. ATCC 35155]|nr:carboxyvinyl-carboxyphosphonate phosphorylmutase [Stella sp. ATCC 35155]
MAGPGRRLVELLDRPEVLAAPGVPDALSARLVAEAGFEAVYMSGDATTAVRLGMPDVGLLTMSEMVDNAGRIADAVDLPVIADADTGYGGPVNVRRTVRDYERAGVAAIQMEDQVWPKRCGHLAGKRVIPAAEMAAKVKAAVDARRDRDFLVIARTDALAIEGFQAALDRVALYGEAGADILFVEAPTSLEQLATIGRLPARTMYNASASGRTPILDTAELTRLGFALAIYPGQALFAAIPAIRAALRHIRLTGDPRGMPVPLAGFADYVQLLGIDEVRAFEAAHGLPEDQQVGI